MELKVGDHVWYIPDGSLGTVIEIKEELYHIAWEDFFCSWERLESLRKKEALSR